MFDRVTVVETAEEFAAIAHLRGWCHNSVECPICAAYRRGQGEAVDEIASGN